MAITRREFLRNTVFITAAGFTILGHTNTPVEAAPADKFQPTWDSLQQYECPEWFRDAKLGIWAHWSAQCVPEQGDWYAQQMYNQGSGDYNFHCATYGHPSKFGMKDLDHIWLAENWDPEHLIGLYKAAGAKYFFALGNHHDNFDTWNSKYQPWNTVNIGMKKDVVGTWAKVARAHGMKFGVSIHASHTWNWWENSQGSDKTGPLAGVPYDGKLTKADGVGKWWEGYDPQDLYAQNHAPGGGGWEFEGSTNPPTQAYMDKFYNRCADLIDQHSPDVLYFDDHGMPLANNSDVGLRIAAYLYNHSAKQNGGVVQAVFNTKDVSDEQEPCIVRDYERGQSETIKAHPWQTDTCIGNWHYDVNVFKNHGYKTPRLVVRMLVDIVSKNGNLMLNIPVKGDGTIDADEIAFLEGFTAWMKVNGDAIFATRPWKIYGEGPKKGPGGEFNEGGEDAMGAQDFRFTTKGNVLYATAMGWPDSGKLTIRTLASGDTGIVGTVKTVELLGSPGHQTFATTADGLVVDLPTTKPCDHAYILKITGLDLAGSNPVPPAPDAIHAEADGSITLSAELADTTGAVKYQAGGTSNLGYWDSASDTASWKVRFDAAGSYAVSLTYSSQSDSALTLDAGNGVTSTLTPTGTGDWDTYKTITGTPLAIPAAGEYTITAKPTSGSWKPINLATVKLTPTKVGLASRSSGCDIRYRNRLSNKSSPLNA